ncbi:radical SAM domain protein [Clostridiales bacterium oral taxon 876 str. F0540]|nr:radical SAM domain protein [Clostridiales bacterium oral taxon 876 str. F0540]
MKVVLAAVNSKFIHTNLALRYLKEYTRDLNYDCKVMEFSINDRLERIVEEIISEKPALVAFSCYIWNMYFVEQLTALIRLIDSNIKILYGGPEVSYDSIETMENSSADYIIEGEGEETYREFIKNIIEDHNLSGVRGLYYRDYNLIKYGGRRELMDLNKLAFPYTDVDDLENKIVYYESSRGCPFNCKYCLSSTVHGVRFLDIDRVKNDLKFFIDKKVRLVKFVDRTFNCNSKFAIEVWKYLIGFDTETAFHFEISADILKDEQLELLKSAPKGRFQFEIGVQTTNNQVLRNINRYVAFEQIKKQVVKLKDFGNIKQHLDLIAGLPGENLESFKKSFNDLYSIEPNEIQLGFLKVLKGTDMKAEAEEWGIIHSPYTPYEVLKTNDISYEELILLKRVEEMVDKYYNSNKFSNILKYFVNKFNTPFDFYLSLGMFFHDKGYFKRNITSVDYYKVFIEFLEETMEENSDTIREIIKFDYLSFNRKKWLPDFLTREFDKTMERNLKDSAKKNDIYIEFSNFHLEKFNIDVLGFMKHMTIKEEIHYLIFDEDDYNNILDITNDLKKLNLFE